jgi:hypothetical protein
MTANANMSPVGFTIISGNKNDTSWKQSWKFMVELHPSINSGTITMVTDQDKGQKMATSEHLTSVG